MSRPRRFRSALSGRWVPRSYAQTHPATTVSETVLHRSLQDVAARLARYNGPDAFEGDPQFWEAEAASFLAWLHQ